MKNWTGEKWNLQEKAKKFNEDKVGLKFKEEEKLYIIVLYSVHLGK
jgi:hypothetical protein